MFNTKTRNKPEAIILEDEISYTQNLSMFKIFDMGIQACNDEDESRIFSVINTLKELITSQYEDVSAGYCRLYDYCIQFVKDKRFDKAADIFYELHQSWNMVAITSMNDK